MDFLSQNDWEIKTGKREIKGVNGIHPLYGSVDSANDQPVNTISSCPNRKHEHAQTEDVNVNDLGQNEIPHPIRQITVEDICPSQVFTVRTVADVQLGAWEKVFFKVKLETPSGEIPLDGTEIYFPKNMIKRNVLIAESLSVCENACVPIMCVNTSDKDIKLPLNMVCGNSFSVKEVLAQTASAQPAHTKSIKLTESLSQEELEKQYREILQDSLPDSPDLIDTLIPFLVKNKDVIALKGDALGRSKLVPFHIQLNSGAKPIFIPPYRVPHSQRSKVEEHISDMLDNKVIQPSISPWSAPMILVGKKDGSTRPCIDFRKLNDITVPDRFPIPNMMETILNVGNAKYFSSLDLASGYWQMEVDQESRKYTAFSTTRGHFEFQVLPFGVRNGPANFSRLMTLVLGDILGIEALVYLDDIIVFSNTIEEHFGRLNNVCERLRKANLKVKLSKCTFFKESLVYLGFLLSSSGIKPDPSKLEALERYPTPRNTDEVRSFLGFVGFYRNFIKNFSEIANPLTDLLQAKKEFVWGPPQQSAFNNLISKLKSKPILQFPDYHKPFVVATDASNFAVGAVLLQETQGTELPIAYASRLLNKAERNYSTTDREALAIVWALKKFRNLIYGYKIVVKTDHKPLTYLFTNKLLEGRQSRWALLVQDFKPELIYNPGKFHIIPDGLSRINKEEKVVLRVNTPVIDELSLLRAQGEDPRLKSIISDIKKGVSNPNFILQNDILYSTKQQEPRIELPDSLLEAAIQLCHDTPLSGHMGPDRTHKLLSARYHYPGLLERTKEYIAECHSCLKNKGKPPPTSHMHTYPAPSRPWSRTAMDILGPLPLTAKGNKYIICFTDHLTRYSEIVPIPDQSSVTVAEALLNNVIKNHTTPTVLISDNALSFTSNLFKSLCNLCKIDKVQITAYHPAANGLVERQNRKILDALKHLVEKEKSWDEALPMVQTTINNGYNVTIGDTPHFALYHYDKRLPFDLPVPLSSDLDADAPESNLQQARRSFEIFEIIRQHLDQRNAEVERRQREKCPKQRQIQVGSRVYIKAVKPPKANRKLYQKWDGPFRLMTDLGLNRYELVNLKTHKSKIVHGDQFKMCPEVSVKRKLVPQARTSYAIERPLPEDNAEKELERKSEEEEEGFQLYLEGSNPLMKQPNQEKNTSTNSIPPPPSNHQPPFSPPTQAASFSVPDSIGQAMHLPNDARRDIDRPSEPLHRYNLRKRN